MYAHAYRRIIFQRSIIILFAALLLMGNAALAQEALDNTGVGKLNGEWGFREVIINSDLNGSNTLAQRVAQWGTITFDGTGGFTFDGDFWTSVNDSSSPSNYSSFYSIGANGYGFLAREDNQGGDVYGLVSGDVFIGSSTESKNNSLIIAVRKAAITVADFTETYQMAYMNFSGEQMTDARNAWFLLSPDGAGKVDTMNLVGSIGRDRTEAEQSIGGVNYSFTDNTGELNLNGILVGDQLMSGIKTFYVSADRSLVIGGSTTAADFFVGIREPDSDVPATAFDGLYFGGGLELNRTPAEPAAPYLGSHYGSISVTGQTVLGHQRYLEAPANAADDYTWSETITVGANGEMDDLFDYHHQVSADGAYRVGFGRDDFLGIWVMKAIPGVAGSGGDPFINPFGVLNAASYSPFTAGLSRGAVVTLFGSNFASELLVDGTFPISLGGVTVRVNGQDARVYVVAPNQISFVLPYNLQGPIAGIQVFRNGTPGNRVTAWLNNVSPGVFTIPANGISQAAALHADFTLVTTESPAMPGETILVYLTGLGAVDPAVVAGDLAPADPLSRTTEVVGVGLGDFDRDYEATVGYSGLAPFLGGLYQWNIKIADDQPAGEALLYFYGSDAFGGQARVPIGGSNTGNALKERKANAPSVRKTNRGLTNSPGSSRARQ